MSNIGSANFVSAYIFIALNVLVLGTAAILSCKLVHNGGRIKALSVLVIYVALINFLSIVIGYLGIYSVKTALTTSLIVFLVTALVVGHNVREREQILLRDIISPSSGRKDVQRLIVLALWIALLGQIFAGGFFAETAFDWDDLAYHAAVVGNLLQSGDITYAPFTYQAYFPLSAELLAAWYVLPYGNDTFASIVSILWFTIAGLSAYSVIRDLTDNSNRAFVGAFVVTGSWVFLLQLQSFSANYAAGVALFLAALAFLVPCLSGNTDGQRNWQSFVLSITAAGLAVGTKVTFAIPTLVIVAVWFAILVNRSNTRVSTILSMGSLVFVVTGGFWYLRNLFATGNPFFPAETLFFQGPFSGAELQSKIFFSNKWRWLRHPEDFITSIEAGDWSYIMVLAVLLALAYLARDSLSLLGRRLWAAVVTGEFDQFASRYLIGFIGALMALQALFLPFSAGGNRPYLDVLLYMRFLVAPAAVLCLYLISRSSHRVVSLLFAATAIAFLIKHPVGVIVFVVAAVSLLVFARDLNFNIRVGKIVSACGIAFVVALLVAYPGKKARTADALFLYGATYKVGEGWRDVNLLPQGSRIGSFGSDPHMYTQYYPMFGREHQIIPVALDDDGAKLVPLHQRWKMERQGWWGDWQMVGGTYMRFQPEISASDFVANVRNSRVDFVFVSKWSLGVWPPQYELLKEAEGVVSVCDDGATAIFSINEGKLRDGVECSVS